jgi:predicted lysophospholipase L1 biosynthesis ABC-type transport system permease subunit
LTGYPDSLRAAPGISISGIDSPDRGRLISTYTSLITAATIVAILLSLAATLAAVADRSLERRRHAAHLTALGLPPNTLRNAETLTLVTPLAIGIVVAGLATIFSAFTYFQLAESPIELPISSVAIIFGIAAVGAAFTAITAYTTTSVTHPTTALRTE